MSPLLNRPGCVFVSYHRGAADVARWVTRVLEPLLIERLPHQGIVGPLSVFRDETSIPPGAEWPAALRNALREASVMVSVFTPEYFTRPWCLAEFRTMLARQRRIGRPCILPIRYSDGDYYPPEARALERVDMEEFYRVRTHRQAPRALAERVDGLCQRINEYARAATPDPEWEFVIPVEMPSAFLEKPMFSREEP